MIGDAPVYAGAAIVVALIVAYGALISLGRAPTPKDVLPTKRAVLQRLFGSRKKRKRFAYAMSLPLLGAYFVATQSSQIPERGEFIAFLAFVLYFPSIWYAFKIKDKLIEDTRIPVRSREYQDGTEITYKFPEETYRRFSLINCYELDSVWTPEHGSTKIALDVDLDNRLIMGNHRSIPDSQLEGLPGDVRRLVENLAPAKMKVERMERSTLEFGREIANEIIYRREVGLSDMEDPDLYNEDGKMPRPWVAACENLGIEYDKGKSQVSQVNMKQTIEKSKKQTDRAEKDRSKSRINIEELQGMRNGESNGKTEAQNGDS
jgi:hypothetical protein